MPPPGSAAPSHQVTLEARARQALDSLKQAYTERDSDGFFAVVSGQPYFNWSDMWFNIVRQFNDFSQIELSLWVDHTLVENDRVIFKTHWQKGMTSNKTGQRVITSGRAELVFRVREKALLLDIWGTSPWTQ